jgi:hypothetical protein
MARFWIRIMVRVRCRVRVDLKLMKSLVLLPSLRLGLGFLAYF